LLRSRIVHSLGIHKQAIFDLKVLVEGVLLRLLFLLFFNSGSEFRVWLSVVVVCLRLLLLGLLLKVLEALDAWVYSLRSSWSFSLLWFLP